MTTQHHRRPLYAATFDVLRASAQAWSEDGAAHWAATLAFYTMLSAGPLLCIAVTVAGLVFGPDTASQAMTAQAAGLMGDEAAQALETMMRHASETGRSHEGLLSNAIGLATLIFGASGVFSALQDAMNCIWHVRPKGSTSVGYWLKRRFLSSSMVLGMGFLLMVSLLLNGVIAAVWSQSGTAARVLSQIGEFASAWFLGTALIAAMFKLLPDTSSSWRCALAGAAGTALLLNIGKEAIGHYLGASGVTSPFGAAGSLALVLIWVYYAAQVLFFGAALTRVMAKQAGETIRPDENAEAVKVVRTGEP